MKTLRNSHKNKIIISISLLTSTLFWYCYFLQYEEITEDDSRLLVLTVATNFLSPVKRFQRSAEVNGLTFKILGLGVKYEGFGTKVNLLKEELKRHVDDPDKIILFTDAHDVLINSGADQIIKTFKKFNANIVFSAEGNCWPDASLASRHPPVAEGKRYLNSGLIIAYAADLYRLVTLRPITNDGNDQLHYQNIYIDDTLRQKLNIKLDHRSEMFQSLFQALDDVELRFKGREAYVHNIVLDTSPLFFHANGLIKPYIDTLGNYIPKAWNPKDGCTACLERTITLSNLKEYEYPSVLLGVFIKKTESDIDKFIAKLASLNYPPNKIQVFLYKEGELLTNVSDTYLHHYSDVKSVYQISEETAKEMAVNEFQKRGCDYYFYVDSDVYLDNAEILQLLIEQNRPIVAPLLQDSHATRTNFMGALQPEFYPSSMDILKNNRRGLWKVPHVSNCYLIQGAIMINPNTRPSYAEMNGLDSDASFSANMRLRDVEMFVSNRFDFGHFG